MPHDKWEGSLAHIVTMTDIGTPVRRYTVVPLIEPFPERREKPAPEPVREPVREPARQPEPVL